MNPTNPQTEAQLAVLGLLHRECGFFPTARQRELLNDLTSAPSPGLALLGYGGAMGGGKTRAIVELAIDAALAYPNNNVLVARQHYSDLSATTMREFFAACPPNLIRRRQQSPTHLVELALQDWPKGQSSTVNFRHLSDWPSLGSQQYGAVLIDEAGQVDEDAALMLLTRLRDPAQPQRWFVAASNPWPGWFERWFVRRDLPERALEQASGRVLFIPASIPDNPHLPPNYAELNHALLPNHWRDRFIEGRFDALLGRVYPDFDTQRHLWDAPLPPFTHYVGGLDFGGQTETAHHTAGIIAGLTTWPGQMPRAFPSPPLPGQMPRAFPSPSLQREMPRAFPSPPLAGGDAARVPLSPLPGQMPRAFPSPPLRGEMPQAEGGSPPPPNQSSSASPNSKTEAPASPVASNNGSDNANANSAASAGAPTAPNPPGSTTSADKASTSCPATAAPAPCSTASASSRTASPTIHPAPSTPPQCSTSQSASTNTSGTTQIPTPNPNPENATTTSSTPTATCTNSSNNDPDP